ncbi:MAG: YabP/YqfC family sporulation protein [Clostridiales bacterium]|nr:YabP/YqfC family sporulation protein [Clostridiales bacterium]
MSEVIKPKAHKVVMDNRNSMSMTGITKVTSIDQDLVLLVTEQGKLKITGKNMQANNLDLDKGILELTGNFNTMIYSGEKDGALSLKGLFK